MPNLNQVNFIGHAGRNAEMKTSKDGSKQWCEFSLAIQVGNLNTEKAMWVKCSVWNKSAEKAALFIKKGDPVFVTGRISKCDIYQNKNGDHAIDFMIAVNEWQLLAKREQTQPGFSQEQTEVKTFDPFDGIPF